MSRFSMDFPDQQVAYFLSDLGLAEIEIFTEENKRYEEYTMEKLVKTYKFDKS
jgi:hypothetical protein